MRRSDTAPCAGLILERFDYTRVGDHLAVARVQAMLPGAGTPPEAAELSLRDGGSLRLRFPLRSGRLERRLCPGGSDNVWTALFAVPASFTGRSGIVFELRAEDQESIVLPFPVERPAEPRGLELVPATESAPRAPHNVRQAVALATVAAVTASSMPASALADAAVSAAKPAPKTQQIASLHRALHRQQTQVSLGTHTAAVAASHPARAASGARTVTRTTPHHASPQSGLASRYRSVTQPAHPKPVTSPPAHPTTPPAAAGSPGPAAPASAPPATPQTGTTPTATTPGSTPTGTTPTGTTTTGPVTTPPASTGPSGGVATGTGDTPTPAPAPTTPAPVPTTPAPAPVAQSPSPIPVHVKPEPRTHGHKRARVHHPSSGGEAIRPLGGLTDKPPVRLASTPAPGSTALSSTPAGFSGPTSWTGTVNNDPALVKAVGNLSAVLADADHPPRFLIPIYMEAGRRYHVPWEVLAAINSVESDYGRNLNTSTAGAIGWMQFEPSTWQRYGLAADGHSVPNPYDPRDAIFSAARYLAAAGASQDLWGAVYAYNHASWYVDMVLSRARSIAAAVRPERQTNSKRGVISVFFSAVALKDGHDRHRVVRYRGGFLSHYVRMIAAANMVSAANFPYVWGGGHEQPARFGPFDCSGSVSYVMQQAGYKVPTSVSGNIGSWRLPSGPGRVTIFYNPTHTFMRIGNRYFGTSGFARPGGGAGWFSTDQLPVGYLSQFQEVHVPQLGSNSFAAPRHRRHSRTTATRPAAPVVAPIPTFSPGLLHSLTP